MSGTPDQLALAIAWKLRGQRDRARQGFLEVLTRDPACAGPASSVARETVGVGDAASDAGGDAAMRAAVEEFLARERAAVSDYVARGGDDEER